MIDRWRDKFPVAAATLTFGLAAILGACGGAGDSGDGAVDAPAAWPSWLAELPEQAAEGVAGEPVWAVVPERGSENATLATYRLEAVSGSTAVLVDTLGNRFEDIPGALVHPVSAFSAADLPSGAPALAERWDAGTVVGRVERPEEGELELAYDWNGVTLQTPMETVMPLPAEGDRQVLRWVAFPASSTGSAWFKGLCFAESPSQLWIRTDAGHVEVIAKDAVRTLSDLGQADFQAGTAVAAYSGGHGYRDGSIREVLEPGLRYAVELAAGETKSFYFADLTTVLDGLDLVGR